MEKCGFCGESHGVKCPTVKAVEYHANGKVKRVEFMTPRDYHPMPGLGPLPPKPYYPTSVPYCDPFPSRIVCGTPNWGGVAVDTSLIGIN